MIASAVVLASACGGDDEADPAPLDLPDRDNDGGGAGDAKPEPILEAGSESCTNGVKDGDETDVDCGGTVCPTCPNGGVCKVGRDCASLVCTANKCTNDVGCSDGTREAFVSPDTFKNIAACSGGWSLPGLGTTTSPACGRVSGNSSANPTGMNCNVADLCQPGWHVCLTPAEVTAKVGSASCAGATVAGQNAFFAIRVSGSGGAMCSGGTNDIFGCGNVGQAPDVTTCAPLDRFSFDLCSAIGAPWNCGTDGANELGNVTKTGPENGGVLCCRE